MTNKLVLVWAATQIWTGWSLRWAQTASLQTQIRRVTSRLEEKQISSWCLLVMVFTISILIKKTKNPHYGSELRSELMDHFATPSCFKPHTELVTQSLPWRSALGHWSPLTSTRLMAQRKSEQGYEHTNTVLGYSDDPTSTRCGKKTWGNKTLTRAIWRATTPGL